MCDYRSNLSAMSKPYADAQAHNDVPIDAIPCLIGRRHLGFPSLHKQERQLVRIRYGHGRDDYVDYIEYTAKCRPCGTRRIMRRDRYSNTFAVAWYEYGPGYEAPPGTQWDRALLYERYLAEFPVEGALLEVDLTN